MTVNRECDSPKCQLVGRCDGHEGDVSRLGEV